MRDKIDIVILWVDGNDKKWQKKKNFWQHEYGIEIDTPERYRDWDNLKYTFRGIEKFAPWVNHIYLVTDNQRPKWISTDHSKLTIVDHTDIIDKDCLPTFNSRAIEVNMHRIPNLSSQFVYLNDDMFFIKKTSPTDFFEDGLPKETAVLNPIFAHKNVGISKVMYNNLAIINDYFKKNKTIKEHPLKWFSFKNGPLLFRTLLMMGPSYFTGFYEPHLNSNFLKSTFEDVWSSYEEELLETTQSRFRKDSNNNQWLFKYWQFACNNFVPRTYNFGKVYNLSDAKSIEQCANHIRRQKTKLVCVNDTERLEDFNKAKETVNKAFETILAEKSEFEKN